MRPSHTCVLGAAFTRSRLIWAAAVGTTLLVVSVDLALVLFDPYRPYSSRILPLAVALVMLYFFARGDRATLGLVLRPAHGLRFWCLASLVLAAIVMLVAFLAFVAFTVLHVPVPHAPRQPVVAWMLRACIAAPLLEEGIYRLCLLSPLLPLLGKWPTVILSGVVFALLHIFYHNPGPDNLIAGFLFAWVYIESRSVLLPILLHSLANAAVIAFHVFFWWNLAS